MPDPANVKERHGEVRWENDFTVRIGYFIENETSASDAKFAIDALLTGTSFNGIPYVSSSLTEISENKGYWHADALFAFGRPPRRTGTRPDTSNRKDTFNWEVSLENSNEVFFSGKGAAAWDIVDIYPPGNPATPQIPPSPVTGADLPTKIANANVKFDTLGYKGPNESPEGLDVLRPRASFSLDYYPPTAVVTDSYVRNVGLAVGLVNLDNFQGYQPGEVMFTEARGSHTREDGWRFSYKFQVAPNRNDLRFGKGANDYIDGITEGWDFVEVFTTPRSVDSKDPAGNDVKIKVWEVTQCVVWRPYSRTNFNLVLFP